ncbi:protein phosphatase Mn(2+)-dependent 1K-like [Dermacentor albipictus]|uniref:protein phosphatase Mn(2+)-dependent 1K-like n=1 Tax=Dermacentor albipictus TaxID=60249 RepID=UPI0031FCF661
MSLSLLRSNLPRVSRLNRNALKPLFWLHVREKQVLSDPENIGQRQQHINFDTLGTWDNRIDLPLLLQQSIKVGKPVPKISAEHAGCATILGRRTYNEDRYRVKELTPDLLYFAVFDGHGGSACADFCAEHMEAHIMYWVHRGQTDLQALLQSAFIDTNNSFAKYVSFNWPDGDEASSGTTATVCLLRSSTELYVAHVGDSRALLCRSGESRRLTTDHTAGLKLEEERIKMSGGKLISDSHGRHLVNGRLAMTRSLGDLDLKPFGVIALPDVRSIEVKHGKDAFVILTTDGVNCAMSDQEIVDAINSCSSPAEAAGFVTDQAMHFASQDNATAVVMPCGAWGKYRNSGGVANSFGRQLQFSRRF